MTSHVIDLTWLRQFHIITHLEVDLVISHLIYLNLPIKLLNQAFESTYTIYFLIKSTAPLACNHRLVKFWGVPPLSIS